MPRTAECYKAYKEASTGLLLHRSFYYAWVSQMIYTEDPQFFVAAVAPETNLGVFKLFLNPEMWVRFDIAGRMFIFQHEVMHVVYEHCTHPARQHRHFHRAADLFINSTLMSKENLKIPEHPDMPGRPSGLTLEDTCKQLEAGWDKAGQPRTIPVPPPAMPPEFYCNWLDDNWPPDPGGDGDKDGDGNGEFKLDNEHDHPEMDQGLSPTDQKILKIMIAEATQRAIKTTDPPIYLSERIEDLLQALKPKVPTLRQKLRKFVGRMGSIVFRPTWRRANKYGHFPRIIPEFRLKLLVVVDTSASMDNEEVSMGLGLLELITQHADVDYMPVDTQCYGPYPFKQRADHKYKIEGRGWTDMRQPFYWMKENKRVYDAVIIWTDLETPFPTRDERMGIPTLWVGTKHYPVPPGAGEVIYVDSVQVPSRAA